MKAVALLRAVNLGPHNKVPMSGLRETAVALGLADAQTVLQSGNLVFSDPEHRAPAQLERLLEQAISDRCGVTTDVFVRDARAWAGIMAANPFPSEAQEDPSHLVVAVGRERIDATRAKALQEAIAGREQVRAIGRELFVYYPDGIGRSGLTAAVIAKHLGGSAGTARNWNTVQRIASLLR